MKIKTKDLQGPALDWAVAKGEGLPVHAQDWDNKFIDAYAYSTEWDKGGPIIEREKIGAVFQGGEWIGSIPADEGDPGSWDWKFNRTGLTPLIAAMRCYVASKLGDEVDVPEELK